MPRDAPLSSWSLSFYTKTGIVCQCWHRLKKREMPEHGDAMADLLVGKISKPIVRGFRASTRRTTVWRGDGKLFRLNFSCPRRSFLCYNETKQHAASSSPPV